MDGGTPGALGVCILLVLAIPVTALPDDDPWPVTQDDAGSGGDAPDTPEPLVPIEPGILYPGTLGSGPLTGDLRDHYAFSGEQGERVQATARGLFGCYAITDSEGEPLEDATTCTLAGWDAVFGSYNGLLGTPDDGAPIQATLEETGTHYLVFEAAATQQYRFSFSFDGAPPEPGSFGQPLPPPGPAPPCHEIFSQAVCRIPADIETVCKPVLADWICETLPETDRSSPSPTPFVS